MRFPDAWVSTNAFTGNLFFRSRVPVAITMWDPQEHRSATAIVGRMMQVHFRQMLVNDVSVFQSADSWTIESLTSSLLC
jgi:hypothetical protein